MEQKTEESRVANTKITICDENGEKLELYVLEETKINGMFYLLAAEESEGDGDCWLLKDVSKEEECEAIYECVENEAEASYVLGIFRELMDASGIEILE